MTEQTMQAMFIRLCRDSRFQLDAVRAAQLTAIACEVSPLEIWLALKSWGNMERIANGTHPVLSSFGQSGDTETCSDEAIEILAVQRPDQEA